MAREQLLRDRDAVVVRDERGLARSSSAQTASIRSACSVQRVAVIPPASGCAEAEEVRRQDVCAPASSARPSPSRARSSESRAASSGSTAASRPARRTPRARRRRTRAPRARRRATTARSRPRVSSARDGACAAPRLRRASRRSCSRRRPSSGSVLAQRARESTNAPSSAPIDREGKLARAFYSLQARFRPRTPSRRRPIRVEHVRTRTGASARSCSRPRARTVTRDRASVGVVGFAQRLRGHGGEGCASPRREVLARRCRKHQRAATRRSQPEERITSSPSCSLPPGKKW